MLPLRNTSIKSFSEVSKNRPAVPRRPNMFETGRPTPRVGGANFEVKDDIMSPLKQIGIYTNPNMMSLSCGEVNELSNKHIDYGLGTPFDRSLVGAEPYTGMSRMGFTADRVGGISQVDPKQKPFTFNSWNSSSF
jgi:hypothetical protein